jgi:LCP family protein required for cell wall assembly
MPGRHRRQQHWVRRLVIGGACIVVLAGLLVAGGYAYLRYRYGQIAKVSVPALTKPFGGDSPRAGGGDTGGGGSAGGLPPMNILLVGNNSRCVLNGKQAAQFGSCAQVGGGRSDVTMVLHLDPATRKAALLSIPRDLWLPIPGTHRALRVDDALNVSPQRLVQTIQDDLGIPINHYVELNFDTFQRVVDDLGGINMYFPDPVKDAYSGLDVPTTGCLHLNGTQALALVRARHMFYLQGGAWHYDGLGDLSRIQRDHQFLKALASQVLHEGLANPIRANNVLGDIAPQLKVDSGFTLGTMLGLVRDFRHVNPATMPSYTLPIAYANSYVYDGVDYGDVVMPLEPADQQTIDKALGLRQPPGHGVVPSQVSVSVLDGSGIPGQATSVAHSLRALGFKVTGTGPTLITGQPAETVVRYSPGHLADAERVAEELAGEVTMGLARTTPGAATPPGTDVVVIAGSKLAVAKPRAAARPTSTASTAGRAPQASEPANDAGVSPVLPPRPKLPSFDPRACPAGAVAKPLPTR